MIRRTNTRPILKQLAAKDKRVLVILNRQNVGVEKNTIYGLFVAPGDAVVPIPSDRQIPLKSSVPLINMWLGGAGSRRWWRDLGALQVEDCA